MSVEKHNVCQIRHLAPQNVWVCAQLFWQAVQGRLYEKTVEHWTKMMILDEVFGLKVEIAGRPGFGRVQVTVRSRIANKDPQVADVCEQYRTVWCNLRKSKQRLA